MGTVSRLSVAPVKGLAQHHPDEILIERAGVPGNRQFLMLDETGRWALLKLITGEFRVGVSQTLVVRALAQASTLPATTIAARLMGDWMPTADWYTSALSHEKCSAAYRPEAVSSRAIAASTVVFPVCRGACTTKYWPCSMYPRALGSRSWAGTM